ncbi:SIMPL domain-containing protein [Flavitalea sp. BT771]|uniref:SIMPL domain-containing protein n=1 Tax=Flavitalea sp. BT771 TaxID=3063329 RepID=UPI0026E18D04|nr:SIMPL domain-containing protein [Flavitalea sp. BT771]MDO6431884.1 SIMPL domain-containing protein [Flavitalea sp. BT771]MDV6220793.1 SIMPL domain-containing protein [Flavitalea sp. BT771]
MKPLSLLLALTITTRLSAQEKFIEVSVSDTVLAEAQTFVLKLSVAKDDNTLYYSARNANPTQLMEQQNKHAKRSLDSLILTLKQKRFSILPLSAQDTFEMASLSDRTFSRRILIHTLDSLAQLYQLIKNDGRITSSVEVAVAGDESACQKALWEKLIAKATEKATHIAAFTNHRITGVLSVTDTPEEKSSGGWTSYPPLSRYYALPGWHTSIGPAETDVLVSNVPISSFYPIKAACRVRFSVE